MTETLRPGPLAAALEAELRAAADPARADGERRYLRSDLEHLGVSVPAVRAAVRRLHRAHPELPHDQVVALVRELWAYPVHELRLAAVEVLAAWHGRLSAADLPLLERLLREARTWALVDPLAIVVVGGIVAHEPAAAAALDRWVAGEEVWLRRAALLALLRPLKGGGGDWARFTRYADALLEEREFFLRKAIGWVLREVAKSRPELVVAWLSPRTARVSGVTLREAIRYVPESDRHRLVAAFRARRPAGREN